MNIFADFIFKNLNDSISQSVFSSALKLANVTPVHKKDSKVKKIIQYECGFRKGFSTQHSLLSLLEKCKSAVDNKKVFGALLMDLFKAFDCLSHDLLAAKLIAY